MLFVSFIYFLYFAFDFLMLIIYSLFYAQESLVSHSYEFMRIDGTTKACDRLKIVNVGGWLGALLGIYFDVL